MNTNETSEKEIDLVDMFWCMVSRIKLIVALAIVGLIIGLVLPMLKSSDGLDGQIAINDSELKQLQSYDTACKAYDAQIAFNASDRRMLYDVNNVHCKQLMYVIDAQEARDLQIIAKVYTYELNSDGDLKNAISVRYEKIEEVSEDDEDDDIINYILYVTVSGIDEEDLDNLVSHAQSLIDEAKPEINASYGAHTLTLTEGKAYTAYDQNYLDFQQGQFNKVTSLSKNITDIEVKFTENLKAYIAAGGDVQGEPVVIASQPAGRSINIKFAALGAVAGAILAMGFVFVSYVISPYIRLNDDLDKVLGMPVLGCAADEATFKGVNKVRYKDFASLSMQGRIDMIAVSIKVLAKSKDAKRVFVTGANMTDASCKEAKVIELLKNSLKDSGIELVIGSSILADSTAMEEAAKVGFVILAEQAGKSRFADVEREAKQLSKLGIKILGAILL